MSIGAAGNVTIAAPSSGIGLTLAMATSGLYGLNITASSGQFAGISLTGNGNTQATSSLDIYQSSTNQAVFNNRANGVMEFYTNNALRLSIAAAGNVTIAAPSSGAALAVTGLASTSVAKFMAGSVEVDTYISGIQI
jgi:hypothetical protein